MNTLYSELRNYLVNQSIEISVETLYNILPKHIYNKIKFFIIDKKIINKFILLDYFSNNNPSLVILIPSWNNSNWVKYNLESVFNQSYDNYRIIYIDDCSNDNTVRLVENYVEKFNMKHRFRLVKQPSRNYQGCARFIGYHLCDDDEIICMLDGDDWLYDNNSLKYIANEYIHGAMCTYGCYKRFNNNTLENYIYCKNDYFPINIIKNRSFRMHRWISQHMRTAYAGLFKRIKYIDLIDNNNRFLSMCTDLYEMFPVLEMAYNKIKLINNVIYVYNKDASNQHNTSYFRQNEFPNKKKERLYIENKIKTKEKYDIVSINDIYRTRNLECTFGYDNIVNNDYIINSNFDFSEECIKYLVKIIDICQLPLLGIDINIKKKTNIFVRGCYTGYLNQTINETDKYIIGNKININNLSCKIVMCINSNEFNVNTVKKLFN
jgi:glycosyltransferase involved in cell wall biosynthesis